VSRPAGVRRIALGLVLLAERVLFVERIHVMEVDVDVLGGQSDRLLRLSGQDEPIDIEALEDPPGQIGRHPVIVASGAISLRA
jgi:hypothetical protein